MLADSTQRGYVFPRDSLVCLHVLHHHLAMIDRGGPGHVIGERLVALSKQLFRHWHRVRDGTLAWPALQERMRRLRREVKQALEDGSTCGCAKTGATYFEILKVEEGPWTFARAQGVEPTNNVAERAVRHAVIWRGISGVTDSINGSRFVERMLTVIATCRQQGRNVLDYLTSCFEAKQRSQPGPSLLPPKQRKLKAA
jgi:transposase